MKTPQLLQEIDQEFRDRFGLVVDIEVRAHSVDNPKLTRKMAEYVAGQLGRAGKNDVGYDFFGLRSWITFKLKNHRVILFYPAKEDGPNG